MKKKIVFSLLILFIGFLLGWTTYYIQSQKDYAKRQNYTPPVVSKKIIETERAFSDIVNSVSPAVVNISTIKTYSDSGFRSFNNDSLFDFFNPFKRGPRKYREQSLGSGVIVSSNGYIITNNHVIEQADEIRVILYDKRSFKAKVVGVDSKTDLALIKIKGKNLPTIPWGDSDKLKVGEFVLAIGNPFGLSHTVTMGIISAVGRANVGVADYEDFIQTDAAINPGNSGGPLVNIKGELIGINTAIFSRSGGYQGIGFAVPSNMAKTIIEQLKDKGRVIRGWLGVTIQDLTPELADRFGLDKTLGALVSDVFKGSPAEKSGIKRGDVIIEFDGRSVSNVSVLRNLVAQSRVGSKVKIKVVRKGKKQTLWARIIEIPDEFSEVKDITPKGRPEKADIGLTVTELTPSIARQIGLPPDERGVVVLDVQEGSSAQEAGIKKGDVIQEIDDKVITGYDDWKTSMGSLKPDQNIVMFINRKGRKFYIVLKP
ncbi:MAG: DegQ family serine endoprotease [Nitrospirae bacterium]|nr:DegQ family serine endoprotease [Nitrospirota bacterium]